MGPGVDSRDHHTKPATSSSDLIGSHQDVQAQYIHMYLNLHLPCKEEVNSYAIDSS